MNKINCLSDYDGIAIWISFICAAVITIFVTVIVALSIPKDIFTIGEFWGIGIHRYQIILCSGIVVCLPAYLSVKFFCCWRCPGPPKKAEERYGFPYIV